MFSRKPKKSDVKVEDGFTDNAVFQPIPSGGIPPKGRQTINLRDEEARKLLEKASRVEHAHPRRTEVK